MRRLQPRMHTRRRLALVLALCLCSLVVGAAGQASQSPPQPQQPQPPDGGVVRVRLEARPGGAGVDGAASASIDAASFGAVYDDAQKPSASNQPTASDAPALMKDAGTADSSSASSDSSDRHRGTDPQHQPATPLTHSQSTPPPSRVYVPVPEHMQEDPLQPLFSFDAVTGAESTTTTETQTGARDSSVPPAAHGRHAHLSSFASLVLRVQRRVTSVGMWAPNAMNSRQADPAVPPSTPPGATSSTLNLLATASYARSDAEAGAGAITRTLQLSVLPGPSFARGSMAAHAERFGPEATGFQHALFTMRDRRVLLPAPASAPASIDGVEVSPALLASGEELVSFAAEEAASGPAEPRLPGFGPVGTLRTMSGQHNENWIVYSSGVLRPAPPSRTGSMRLVHNVALYTLLVSAWHDPQLVRAHMDAHRALSEAAAASGAPPPPALSYNALGVRLRVTSDFGVRPFERGVPVLPVLAEGSPGAGEGHTWNNQAGMSAADMHGLVADDVDAAAAAAAPAVSYARIVDFVMYQQRKLILIGVAYDDGFIRVLSRSGVVRNELHTGNQTILLLAMSNWGSSSSLSASAGGGARESNAPLNGANNGNQHMVYVTPSGIGIVRMSRIYSQVDSYCRWDVDASLGVSNGRDISAVAFDPLAHTVLYLASHASDELLVLHTRLGWNHADAGANFDEKGLRRPCPAGGCLCHASASIRMQFASPKSSASSRALFRPHYTLLPLRGFLMVANTRARAIALYNTSSVHVAPNEAGLEFMLERQVGSPPATPASGSSGDQTAAPPLLRLERLTGDRIDLIIAGTPHQCEGHACSAGPSAPQTLHVLQHYLPQPEPSSRSASFTSWMGSSRVPLFLLGLAVVFGWQWWQKRRRGYAAGGVDDTAEMEAILARFGHGGEGKARGGRGGGGRGGGGGGRSDFDPKTFMSDFQQWQRSQKTGAGGGGGGAASGRSAVPRGSTKDSARRHQSSAYLGAIPTDPFDTHVPGRFNGPGGSVRAAYGLRQLEELQRERAQMRRKLDAMDDRAALRGLGLGVGGGGEVNKSTSAPRYAPASLAARAPPGARHAPRSVPSSSAHDSALPERWTDPAAERAFANDPTDGMRAESMRDASLHSDEMGESEGEDGVPEPYDDDEGEGVYSGVDPDELAYDDAPYEGEDSYDSGNSHHPMGTDTASLLALHRATGSPVHTFPIDSMDGMSFAHEEDLARFGVQEEEGQGAEGEEEEMDDPADQQWQSMRARTAAQRAVNGSHPSSSSSTYAVDHPPERASGLKPNATAFSHHRDVASYDSGEDDMDGHEDGEYSPAAEDDPASDDANDHPRFIDTDHPDDHGDDDLDHEDAHSEWIDDQQVDEAERSMRLARLQQADELLAEQTAATQETHGD